MSAKNYTWIRSREHHADKYSGAGEFSGASFYDKYGFEMPQEQRPVGYVARPYYISDLPEFICSMTGKRLSSRSQKREVCKRTGFVDYEPTIPKQSKWARPQDGYACKRMCDATGLPYSENVVGWLKDRNRDRMAPPETDDRNLRFAEPEREQDARGTAEMHRKYADLTAAPKRRRRKAASAAA